MYTLDSLIPQALLPLRAGEGKSNSKLRLKHGSDGKSEWMPRCGCVMLKKGANNERERVTQP